MGPIELPVEATAEAEVAGALLEELTVDVGIAELEGTAKLVCCGVELEAPAEEAGEAAAVVLAGVTLLERVSLLLVACALEPLVGGTLVEPENSMEFV